MGIAVSYGLFSKKNDEPQKEKDHNSPNNAQSYVSKLLQASSVFDDESETVIETLNSSQYFRGQPPVVVVPKQENALVSEITQKPLLLPVRSLKHPTPADTESNEKSGGENVVVLPSPIPWRSRSGRMEMEEVKGDESRSFRPKKLSPSPSTSVSPVRKKGVVAPPPPPPPPPLRKSMLMKSNSSIADCREKEVLRRIVSSVAESEIPRRRNSESMRTFRASESNDIYEIAGQQEEEEEEKMDKVLVETSDEDEEDDEMGGPDVDKKADEFIAKFREQIRQQRIESIRRSTAQRTAANSK